ncbi:transmembrane signal receptor [Lithospermum erythrorhizon]|uniref:Transmembrane signal receptor n=1 Tax=Lithospermum erythrorhizon TaxID=34254 RepID=A0AAV3S3D6_LITER
MTTLKKDRFDYRKMVSLLGETCFISKEEPKDVKAALLDEHRINAIQEESVQFENNDVWELVPLPYNYNVIGTKWIFKNKFDEFRNVTRNKNRLVAQGYTQIKGVDFEETFTPVARLEFIKLLLALACLLKFKLYHMNVKSSFLKGIIQEEVYVEQPKAWYERLKFFLLKNGYSREGVDNALFIKKEKGQLMVAQIYVEDIVEFEMSMVGLCVIDK